jgi:hypothetical protein
MKDATAGAASEITVEELIMRTRDIFKALARQTSTREEAIEDCKRSNTSNVFGGVQGEHQSTRYHRRSGED